MCRYKQLHDSLDLKEWREAQASQELILQGRPHEDGSSLMAGLVAPETRLLIGMSLSELGLEVRRMCQVCAPSAAFLPVFS